MVSSKYATIRYNEIVKLDKVRFVYILQRRTIYEADCTYRKQI